MAVEVSGERNQRPLLLVLVVDDFDHRRLALVDGERLGFRVIVIAQRDAATVPLSVCCSGQHGCRYALRSHVTLQLREYQDDFEHGLAHRRACVELLVLADEDHSKLLQLAVHGGEVQQVTADTVDFPYEDMREHPQPDLLHHLLKFWAVCILARIARILIDDVVLRVQDEPRVVDEVLPLHRQGVLVYLVQGRYAGVYCHAGLIWQLYLCHAMSLSI